MTTTKATSTNAIETEEDYEFCAIEDSGKVNVANLSYGEDEAKDHIHTVTIRDGTAVSCTCKGHKYNATTKHREAVENHQAVIDVADPNRCSNSEEFCPGPAAISVEDGPEGDSDPGCFDCWMAACASEGDA